MGGDMFQRSHLELLFIVPSTSFRSAVRAFIRAARHAPLLHSSLVQRLPRPSTKGQSALLTTRCRRARVAARHAPSKEALCASPSPTTKGQSALTPTDRRARLVAYAAPPRYHQRPVCSNYDGPARARAFAAAKAAVASSAVQQ